MDRTINVNEMINELVVKANKAKDEMLKLNQEQILTFDYVKKITSEVYLNGK